MAEAFVYCWTDTLTNKLYVGYHKGTFDDGYVCSSKLMLEEYENRSNDFSRQILAEGSVEEMLKFEQKILESANAAQSEDFYNRHNGGAAFVCVAHSEETKQKMSKRHKGKKLLPTTIDKIKQFHTERNRSEETKQKMRDNNTKSWLGKTHSEETKKKMSESMSGIKHKPFYGRPVSEETKQKIRESMKKSVWHNRNKEKNNGS